MQRRNSYLLSADTNAMFKRAAEKSAEHITHAKQQFGRHHSFCKSGRFAGTIIFALQKSNKQLSLLIPFRQDTVSSR